MKSFPLRRMDSGEKFNDGSDTFGAVMLIFGALILTFGLSAPQPSHPKSSGMSNKPNSHPNPGERR